MSSPLSAVHDDKGSSAVEFAMVVPALFLLLFGCIEVSRLLWTREALQETAISAARCMGVKLSSCASGGTYSSSMTTSYVQSVASSFSVQVPASGVTLNNNTSCSGVSGFSQVSIAYTFRTVVPGMLGAFASTPITAMACFPNQT